MGLPCVFVCVCKKDFFIYFRELERCLFPTNQVLPTCQARQDVKPFKTPG